MRLTIKSYQPVAIWKWDTSKEEHKLYHYARGEFSAGAAGFDDGAEDYEQAEAEEEAEEEEEEDVCGICRLAFESCCPECKIPGDDCPLIWGECTHVFHMHCLLKWIATESSNQQCPLDRRPWVTADRKPDKLPTTITGQPVASIASGPLRAGIANEVERGGEEDLRDEAGEMRHEGNVSNSMEVDERELPG